MIRGSLRLSWAIKKGVRKEGQLALQNQCLFSRNSSIIKELLVDRHSRALTAIEPLCHGELPSSCPSRRFLSLRYRIPMVDTDVLLHLLSLSGTPCKHTRGMQQCQEVCRYALRLWTSAVRDHPHGAPHGPPKRLEEEASSHEAVPARTRRVHPPAAWSRPRGNADPAPAVPRSAGGYPGCSVASLHPVQDIADHRPAR